MPEPLGYCVSTLSEEYREDEQEANISVLWDPGEADLGAETQPHL